MSRILVVDQARRPLMPTTPARARIMLKGGKAAILRRFPLMLILSSGGATARQTGPWLKDQRDRCGQ